MKTISWRQFTGAVLFSMVLPAAAAAQTDPQDPAKPEPACVAVMPAAVAGMDGNAAEVALTMRDAMVSFLTGPSLRPVAVDARLKVQALEEARQKGCSHFIAMTVTKKSGGRSGFGRVVGQAAGTAAWHLPGSATVGGAVARSASIGVVSALADMASTTRAKDEMKLEWTLTPLAATGRPSSKEEKAKASADGEDLFSPLLQRSAEAIAELLLRK